MRIIAGKSRGRPVISPSDDTTRPITDRAKQSLFDALAVAVDFSATPVLDCVCDTGSLGLECLSRGSPRVVFVENGRSALENLRNNIVAFGVKDRSDVLRLDAYRTPSALAGLPTPDGRPLKFLLAFVDPPYAQMESPDERDAVDNLVQALALDWVPTGGLIILRHPTEVKLTGLRLAPLVIRQMVYGSMTITWLETQTGTGSQAANVVADHAPADSPGDI